MTTTTTEALPMLPPYRRENRDMICGSLKQIAFEAAANRGIRSLTSRDVTGEDRWSATDWDTFLWAIEVAYGVSPETVEAFFRNDTSQAFTLIAPTIQYHGLALYGNAYPVGTSPDATTEDEGLVNPGELAIGPDDYPLSSAD